MTHLKKDEITLQDLLNYIKLYYSQLVILDGVSNRYKQCEVLFTNCLGYHFTIKYTKIKLKSSVPFWFNPCIKRSTWLAAHYVL
jgi:hypothetical protein